MRYLAPLMMEALEKAAPDQQVGFRPASIWFCLLPRHVGSRCGLVRRATKETTRGSLYAYRPLAAVRSLTEYRFRSERGDRTNLTNRQFQLTGLANHTLFFVPEAAERPDSFRGKSGTDNTLSY